MNKILKSVKINYRFAGTSTESFHNTFGNNQNDRRVKQDMVSKFEDGYFYTAFKEFQTKTFDFENFIIMVPARWKEDPNVPFFE